MNIPGAKCILIVDDDLDYCRHVASILSSKYVIQIARTLADGIRQFATGAVEAVLLDLGLPDCPAHRTVDLFKADFPNAPVVVVSGDPRPDVITETILKNASGYIIKGVDDKDANRFCKEIDHAIDSHAELQTLRRVHDHIAKA